ncbi:MAG: 2-amino-4-hydroxy-6-hydroxymethyldihydropteridine diphosphokinase [Bacteroidales bacterium]|nr:2-amino-4-hydroxy-6-hydroxymethyldihydropteridine diphosphokinase [Bacteroidales bacterium]MBN2763767.1 2-amino-4-hydroxy-6-hydroxymethyldihydropteridine diphosphokinase [Bacteroidales bacterium]
MKSQKKFTETAYILFGSNLGDRFAQISKATDLVVKRAGQPVAASSVYETEPWGFTHQIPFLNKAMSILTHERPGDLMKILLSVEKEMGRVRKDTGYNARNIDIDLLLYGMGIIYRKGLVIPHPRLCERRFALVPLAEIAPEVRHPVMNKSIRQLLEECADTGWVRKFR